MRIRLFIAAILLFAGAASGIWADTPCPLLLNKPVGYRFGSKSADPTAASTSPAANAVWRPESQLASGGTATTNRSALGRFFEAFEKRPGPVRVLVFGDSMSDSYQSIAFHFASRMTERRPFAGLTFNNFYNQSLFASTNGAGIASPSPLWFSHQFAVPANASGYWWNEQDAQGTLADRVGLTWIAHPGGGDFELLISEAGGDWVKIADLNGFAESTFGCATNLNLPLAKYRVQVQSATGTNYLLGPELVNTQTNGLHLAWLDQPGIPVEQVAAISRAIRDPILQSFAPDLILWHFKDGASDLAGLREALEENEDWFRASAPDAEVLYIGTPYSKDADGGANTRTENALVRDFAISHQRAFLDCMTPGESYEWLRDHGYMMDETHPNAVGGAYLAAAGWKDIGFYALGLNRELTVTPEGNGWALSASLGPNLIYTIEQSSDLREWVSFLTPTNQPGPLRITVPAQSSFSAFRFRLQAAE